MKVKKTKLPGVFEIESFLHSDSRGRFVKTFNSEIFKEKKLNSDFKESFYSVSQKNVIRGMHFQTPPFDHEKLVYVLSGEIVDVVVDVRKESPTYGQYIALDLSEDNCKSIYIGKGFAHGFLTKSKTAIVHYMTTSVYSKYHDSGIKWNSFGYEWDVSNPIVSDRDVQFDSLRGREENDRVFGSRK